MTTLDLRSLSPEERATRLDEAVHEHVMHLKEEPCTDGQLDEYMAEYWSCTCGWISDFYVGTDHDTTHTKPIPAYSTSMDAAWLVRDTMKVLSPLLNLHLLAYTYNRVYAQFSLKIDEDEWSEANGEYCGSEAICFAAFKIRLFGFYCVITAPFYLM